MFQDIKKLFHSIGGPATRPPRLVQHNRLVRRVRSFSKPHKAATGHIEDLVHLSYLIFSLVQVILVDAQCVHPQNTGLVGVAQAPQHIECIVCDRPFRYSL